MTLSKVISFLSILFFAFILWVIYLANTGQTSVFFHFVASIPYGDKLGHFCLFGLLTFGSNIVFKLKTVSVANVEIYIGAILVLLFVTVEELSQYFIPNRTLDVSDYMANVVGIITFHVVTKRIAKYV